MNLDTNQKDRSLIVKYIGPCEKLPLGKGIQFSKNKKFYFNADQLDGKDLNVIYKVLPNQFINDDGITVSAFIDGKLIYTRILNKLDYDNLNMIYFKKDTFVNKNEITELEIAVTGLEKNSNNNILMIPYIGKNQLVNELTIDPPYDYMDYHLVTTGLNYDKDIKGWMMGETGEVLLPIDVVSEGLTLKYTVPKELFIANKGIGDITLNIMVNGKRFKDILLNNPGSFDLYMSPNELKTFANNNEGYINMRFHVNSIYNLQKLKVRHQNINRSIDINNLSVGK